MKKQPEIEIKERIIRATISLIEHGDSASNPITTRLIAERAGVGLGLINYHFQAKESLIELCVQRIIEDVISSFQLPDTLSQLSPLARVKKMTKLVADFFIANVSVSSMSILSDYRCPAPDDNTMKTTRGLSRALREESAEAQSQLLASFLLTSTLQTLFLRREQSKALFGYDMQIKAERDQLIDLIIDHLFRDTGFE